LISGLPVKHHAYVKRRKALRQALNASGSSAERGRLKLTPK